MTLLQPFIEFGFMRRALVACVALALSATPLGVFLSLRRMSLIGDALSHAILPGAAVGYLLSGLSLVAMGAGGLLAGLVVALLSGAVSRYTPLKEDASFSGFYLGSLALGVTLVSLRGSSVDLLHVLFGSLLAVDTRALVLVAAIAAITLLGPTIGSLVALTEVLCAVVAAWILVGESVTALQAVGGAAIIAGLVLARLGQSAPKQIPADPMTNVMAEE